MKAKCVSCKFVGDIESHLGCRRNPPIPERDLDVASETYGMLVGMWPLVKPDDVCGEFRAVVDL